MKVRLVHTAVMCWEISDNCINVTKFEVKQDMPGLAIRGGAWAALNSVDKGQYEAGLSIGLRPLAAIRRIVLPQAARIAIPGLSNNFINLFKSTAIGFMIGYKDMMAIVSMETSRSYRFLEGYAAAMLVYWIIISGLSFLQNKMEKRLNRKY